MTILGSILLSCSAGRYPRLGLRHRQQAFALRELARRLLSPADALLLLARLPLGRLLVGAAPLDLAEQAFALELLLQDSESLFNIVVANENFRASPFLVVCVSRKGLTRGLGCAALERIGCVLVETLNGLAVEPVLFDLEIGAKQ